MIARMRAASRGDEGASAVEFALVLPLLVMLAFGIISFGLYFAGLLGLSNATREAARYGVVQNRSCEAIAQDLRSTSRGTLGIVYPITFTITRGSKVCSGSIAEATSANPDGALSFSGDKTMIMCSGSTSASDELIVETRAEATMFVPFVSADLSLTGKGAYRCEFS
jgi:hypothetical protein